MTEQYQQDFEALSALMDNEADDLELRRLLKSSAAQPELQAKWARYHLAHSVLHGSAQAVRPDLAQRIAAQIATEAAPTRDSAPIKKTGSATFSGWQQTLGRVAIAASVAIIFVVAVPTEFSPGDSAPGYAVSSSAGPATEAVTTVQQETPAAQSAQQTLLAAETAPATLDPVATQFLSDYLEHMRIDEEEPAITVHIKDSPLFQLVNQLGVEPQ